MEGGGGANEDGSGELAAIPYGKVQEQCNFDTTCCLSTKYSAMFETNAHSRVCRATERPAGGSGPRLAEAIGAAPRLFLFF